MIHFHYSKIFWFLIPYGLLLLIYFWARWKKQRDIRQLGDWKLLKHLLPVNGLLLKQKKDILILFSVLGLILTAAGPQYGSKLKEVKSRGIDVFIAMDTSRSMLAEDVPPSRLLRAKRALGLLIKKLEGNRIGIIAFAKFAVLQCPLTVDNEAARIFLDVLNTNTVPIQGTSIGDAIRLAHKSFSTEDKGGKAIVLLTDGEDHNSDPLEAAKAAKEDGIVIFTIGIGTTKGEVIKKRDERGKVTEFHKHKGEMVLSRLDDALLTKISSLTGGKYYRASSTDKEIDEIADQLNGFDKKEFSSKIHQRLKEQYQPYLLFILFLFLIEFFLSESPGQWGRIKGALSKKIFTFFLVALFGGPLYANVKDHVIKGNRFIKKGDLAAGRGEFESAQIDAPEAAFLPYNIANTYYLEGNFEEAKVYFDQANKMANDPKLKSHVAYNLGHLTFHMGHREKAVEYFKECLKLNPNDVDAKYNIEYILSGKTPKNPMKQQQKQQQQQKDGESRDKDENSKGNNKNESEPDLSKEDAERVLELIQNQEKDDFKNSKPISLGRSKKDENEKNKNYEDW